MSDYPIIKKKKTEKFPMGGSSRSQVHMNDNSLEENQRRLRKHIDPLKDGWDEDEDPIKDKKPRPDTDIPIR